jgi:acyl-CoA synthetase (AMP-forming)/AMP-acid ligase II
MYGFLVVLTWIERPQSDKGLYFAGALDEWKFVDFESLAHRVSATARWFTQIGLPPAGVVAIVLPTGLDFVAAFFGTLAAGGTPCPLAPPGAFTRAQDYIQHCGNILRTVQPSLVVADQSLLHLIAEAAEKAGVPAPVVVGDVGTEGHFSPRPLAEISLIQATSGSTGAPRPVRVTRENLSANLAMISRWLDVSPLDIGATWLPPHHDMGLIGCLLMPVAFQMSTWIMRPDQFIANPKRWLALLGRQGATMTACPSFALKYAARRIKPDDLGDWDFSPLRAVVVGAERVDADALRLFSERLRPSGFSDRAFLPSYGLAEATLSVTGHPVGKVPLAVKPAWSELRFGEPVTVLDTADIGETCVGDGGGWLVGCGAPHPDLALHILNEDGDPVPPGCLGEIAVSGPSVTTSYFNHDGTAALTQERPQLRTGDAGLIIQGELFVIGRIGDSVKVRGRTLYVETLEQKLWSEVEIKRERAVVLAGAHQGDDIVALVAEMVEGPWIDDARQVLARETGEAVRLEIRCVPRGFIQWTSSGKPRRRLMWTSFLREGLFAPSLNARPGDVA